MWIEYLKERDPDIHVLSKAYGFATYKYLLQADGAWAVYIEDIYVIPEVRKSGAASELSEEVQKIAKLIGCSILLGTVCPTAKGSTGNIKVLIAHGMTVSHSEDNLIWFKKDLNNG